MRLGKILAPSQNPAIFSVEEEDVVKRGISALLNTVQGTFWMVFLQLFADVDRREKTIWFPLDIW